MKKNSNLKGLFYSFVDNFLQQIVNFTVGVILARLLTPEDFGLVGIVSIFIAFSNVLVNSGLSESLINGKKIDSIDYNSVFYINVILALLIYIILYFCAPFIALFFEKEQLISILRIAAISILFVSFSFIQRTVLAKNLDFRKIAIVSFISVLISGAVAVTMALNGFGLISLVVRMVLGQIITTILFWTLNSWRPSLTFSWLSVKLLYKYGSNIFLARLLGAFYDNLYYFVIGKFFSASTLGYYTRAELFKSLASTNIASTIQRVSFSSISAAGSDVQQHNLFYKFSIVAVYLTTLCMSILNICADEIVMILLGSKWTASISYLKILALSGILIPLSSLNSNMLAVIGKPNIYLRVEFISKLLAIPTILLGMYFGLYIMLVSIVFVSILTYLLSLFHLSSVLMNNVARKQLLIVGKVLAIFATLYVLNLINFNPASVYLSFVVKLFFIVIFYIFMGKILFSSVFEFISNIITKNLFKLK